MQRTVFAVFAITGLAYGQAPAARPQFEVASIKRNMDPGSRVWLSPPVSGRFTATNVSLKMLIVLAYGVKNFELSGGPEWIHSDKYDLVAKAPEGSAADDHFPFLLQALLEDRFKLMVHHETKEVPVYALLAAKSGLKLPDADPASCVTFGIDTSNSSPPNPCGGLMVTPNRLENQKISMQWFASTLSGIVGRPVIDRTGYTGTFQVHLEFAAEAAVDTSRPSIFTALQEQLGVKLESQKAPGQILVIDHVERAPTEN